MRWRYQTPGCGGPTPSRLACAEWGSRFPAPSLAVECARASRRGVVKLMTDPVIGVAVNGVVPDRGFAGGPTGTPLHGGGGAAVDTERAPAGERFAPAPPRLRAPGQVPVLLPDTAMQKVM